MEKDLKILANMLRLECLEMLHKAGSGHLGGSMSCIEILTGLYFGEIENNPVLKYDPKLPGWADQDYFILSKGHAAPSLYSVLAQAGFFSKSECDDLRKMSCKLQGYPSMKIPGITMTTGMPGQGFSVAVGLALSLKMDEKRNKVYCLLSDEELQEGSVWEALMSASHYQLDNLVVIIDRNKLQEDGEIKGIMNLEPMYERFRSFGWKIFQMEDGHNVDQFLISVEKTWKVRKKPSMIIAPTVKGKGVFFAENRDFYHCAVLSDSEMVEARKICLNN